MFETVLGVLALIGVLLVFTQRFFGDTNRRLSSVALRVLVAAVLVVGASAYLVTVLP